MDPALKQRLLGAAVLVALAIIFLPMLFDGPESPPPPAGSLPLGVPAAPDRPLQTREIPLELPARSAPPVASVAAPGDGSAIDSDRLATVDVPLRPSAEVPEDLALPATAAAPSREVTAAPAAETPPAPPPVAAPPTATQTPPTPPPLPAGNRFVVNLGSYANAANASALLQRLKSANVPAYSESISLEGKPATRLRAGPFASRAAADAAALAAKRVQSDISTAVVGLDGAETAPARPAPAVAGGFIVQVAAFKSEAEANALRDRLRGAGYASFVERVARDEGALWRVRVGPEIQRVKAEQTLSALRQRFQLDGQVLTYP
jgi:cell division septation protein DedD